MTYKQALPDVKKSVTNNWNLLHINQEFYNMFQEPPSS